MTRYNYEWTDRNWERLCENSLDTAHPFFVHKRFSNRISPKVIPAISSTYSLGLSQLS